ncbi:hypothetical protein M422DRAFT_259074 [Sphaerobolus stellatus SS14]|uniref:Uncharacterized protein n=1 Tax=Sphaerobolus stellatus (strain SS14) TaxID=990650 RepID=A0A0C9VA77_SPHS4|nr:hypothetical protein M422DRAFT_259074 [Sphaerobolus stellatus SS14]
MPHLTTLILSSSESLHLLSHLVLPQLRLLTLQIDTSIDPEILPQALENFFNFTPITSIHGCLERGPRINRGQCCLIETSTLSTNENTKDSQCMHFYKEAEDKPYELDPPTDLPDPGQFSFQVYSPKPNIFRVVELTEELDEMVLDHRYQVQRDLLCASTSLHILVLSDYHGAQLVAELPNLCPELKVLEYTQHYGPKEFQEGRELVGATLVEIVKRGCDVLKNITIIHLPKILGDYESLQELKSMGIKVEIIDSVYHVTNRNDWTDYDDYSSDGTISSVKSDITFPDWESNDEDLPHLLIDSDYERIQHEA